MTDPPQNRRDFPRWGLILLLFGLYLTFEGYQSLNGDQAYRLPLLLDRQGVAFYEHDPFVRSFDTFNPHRGYLTLLDLVSRPLGLSACLFGLFALTFGLTCLGLERLTRATWPKAGPLVGWACVGMVLLTKSGNIGTNHLFEPLLLDRLMALALGWNALALAVERPSRGLWVGPLLIVPACWIHPSLGLQLAGLLGVTWLIWGFWPRTSEVRIGQSLRAIVLLGIACSPSLWMSATQGDSLFKGLSPEDFRLLTAYVQSPQHMVPHLWRMPQWLAWGCFPVLAFLTLRGWGLPDRVEKSTCLPPARLRLWMLYAVNLLGLAIAWVAIEPLENLHATLFQPFRMATLARGLALVLLSERVVALWSRGGWADQARVVLLAAGLTGDWSLVVVTIVELAITLSGWAGERAAQCAGVLTTGAGLIFLSRHDPQSGHLALCGGLVVWSLVRLFLRKRAVDWNRQRFYRILAYSWAVPLLAWIVPILPWSKTNPGRFEETFLVKHCRFVPVPVDDVERLSVWCRKNTPPSARFIGPPGPKTFRLWSRRTLAFNRSGVPYHAEGLGDWAERFRQHVAFEGSTADFARAYLKDHRALEQRYDALSAPQLASLASQQGASHVIALRPSPENQFDAANGPLELLHVEGRYAVYRVRNRIDPDQARMAAGASAGTG